MAGSKGLTEKMARFAALYVAGETMGNATQCYLAVYSKNNGRQVAANAGMKLLSHPLVQAEIQRLKDAAGISEEFVLKRLREGADATIVTTFKGRAIVTNVPDHTIRHKFLDTAAKLLEMYPSEKHDHRSINIDVQLEKLPPAELQKLLSVMVKKINVGRKTEARLLGKGAEATG